MAVGISSACFYPLETEQALRRLVQNGVEYTEIFFNAGCETKGSILQTITDIVRGSALKVCALHSYCSFAEPHLIFSPYARRMQDGIEVYKGLCEAANTLGAKLLVLHGEKEPFRISEQAYIERFAQLEEIVRSQGVLLTQENVVHFRSQDPSFLETMRTSLGDNFRLTLDIKQAVRSRVDPVTLVKDFLPNIVHMHISDHGERGDCLPPGEGGFDFEALFSLMHSGGYTGHYMLELYRTCYENETVLLNSFKKVSKIHAKTIAKNSAGC